MLTSCSVDRLLILGRAGGWPNLGAQAEVAPVNVLAKVAMVDKVFNLLLQLMALIHVVAVILMKIVELVLVEGGGRL